MPQPRWPTASIGPYRAGSKRRRAAGAGIRGEVPAEVRAAAAAAGEQAATDVGSRVRALLEQDVDEQRTNPLAVAGAVRYPAEVLREAGVVRTSGRAGVPRRRLRASPGDLGGRRSACTSRAWCGARRRRTPSWPGAGRGRPTVRRCVTLSVDVMDRLALPAGTTFVRRGDDLDATARCRRRRPLRGPRRAGGHRHAAGRRPARRAGRGYASHVDRDLCWPRRRPPAPTRCWPGRRSSPTWLAALARRLDRPCLGDGEQALDPEPGAAPRGRPR